MEALKNVRLSFAFICWLLSTSYASTGLDDILSSSSGSFDFAGPSSLKTQTRGYYNFGGMAVRSDVGSSIRPFHIEMPTIASGCGGVDIGFGGFSFLNIDQLVAKLQKIASAAPAFAFNMALSALCKDCQSIMDQLNAVADSINGLNFDACKSAVGWGKSIGSALNSKLKTSDDAKSGIEDVIGDLPGAISSATNNIQAFINCGSTSGECTDTSSDNAKKKAIEAMKFQGSLVRKVFTDNSSFLSAATSGSNSTSTYSYWFKGLTKDDAEDLFRNMIGDYYGFVDPTTCGGKDSEGGVTAYMIATILPMMSADEAVNMFLGEESGGTQTLKGLSVQDSNTSYCKGLYGPPIIESAPHNLSSSMNATTIRATVESRISDILTNMKTSNNSALKTDAKFLSSLRYPVYKALNVASITSDNLLVGYIADVIVAQELVGLINELAKKQRAFVNYATITKTTAAINQDSVQEIEKRIVAINNKAEEVLKKVMQNMENRVAQISVLDDTTKRFKQELTKKGMYRLGH